MNLLNRRIYFTLSFLIIIYVSPILGQDTISNQVEQKIESIAESMENEDADYSELLEALANYLQHPLNLNNASANELAVLGLLNTFQINNLINHISKNGKLLSIYELQSIEGFDLPTIEKIRPYIKVAESNNRVNASTGRIFRNGTHELTFRMQRTIETQLGYTKPDSAEMLKSNNRRYLGSPEKIYARYRFRYSNNISIGITAEKDPGEILFGKTFLTDKAQNPYAYNRFDSLIPKSRIQSFDFYSAHVYIRNNGTLKSFVLGDYQATFGQGLTLWSGLAFNKSSDIMNIKRTAYGIKPHTSVEENRFMRGGAATIGLGNFEITGFYSRKRIDGNITQIDSLNSGITTEVSSLQTSGIHSTLSTLLSKHSVTEIISGGNISFRKRNLSIGVTGLQTQLSAALTKRATLYNLYNFNGRELNSFSMDYSYSVHNVILFGELANSNLFSKSAVAYTNGCLLSLDPKVSLSIIYRNYQTKYQSLYANAFGENTLPSNEQGLFIGITIKLHRSLTFNTYIDFFKFPWLKYQVSVPSYGNETMLQLSYAPNKSIDSYFYFRRKNKFKNITDDNDQLQVLPFLQNDYRLHGSFQISKTVQLRSRIEFIEYTVPNKKSENGILIFQDVRWKCPYLPVVLTTRYALFDTKSYSSRIYAYESDIIGSYSIPAFYGKGSRCYLLINWGITKNMAVGIRLSQTYYSDRNVISPGTLNQIDGRTKTDIGIQVKANF